MHRIKISKISEGKEIQATESKKTNQTKNPKHPATCFQPEETFMTSQTFTEVQTFLIKSKVRLPTCYYFQYEDNGMNHKDLIP